MRWNTAASLVCGTLALSACATTTPVVAVPGPNKDIAAFQKDDLACRAQASQAAHGPLGAQTASDGSNAEWTRYFAALTQCATAHGDTVAAVPWTTAYAAYLGTPYAYPAFAAPVGYGYGYPYAYGYAGDPFFYGYGYPFFGGIGFYGAGFYGHGYYGHGWGGYRGGWGGYHGGGFGGFHGGGTFGGFHSGGGHR